MAFKKKTEKKDSDIITLIDIIFLLLIFFLLTTGSYKLVESTERKEEYITSKKLPEASGTQILPNDPVKNLLIRIEDDSLSNRTQKIIYFIEPGPNRQTYSQAYKKAQEDSNFVTLSNDTLMMDRRNFLLSRATQAITNKIHTYRQLLLAKPPDDRLIEISADKNTPFRLVYFLMEQCSNGDSLTTIKKVNIRTLGRPIDFE